MAESQGGGWKGGGAVGGRRIYAHSRQSKMFTVFIRGNLILWFLALLVETSRAYAIPRCPSVRPSVRL